MMINDIRTLKNLTPILASEREIRLLRCDIEGAELFFIQNYPELLRKSVAVFELHGDLCNIDLCRRLLEDVGFSHHALFRRDRADSIYCVWR